MIQINAKEMKNKIAKEVYIRNEENNIKNHFLNDLIDFMYAYEDEMILKADGQLKKRVKDELNEKIKQLESVFVHRLETDKNYNMQWFISTQYQTTLKVEFRVCYKSSGKHYYHDVVLYIGSFNSEHFTTPYNSKIFHIEKKLEKLPYYRVDDIYNEFEELVKFRNEYIKKLEKIPIYTIRRMLE